MRVSVCIGCWILWLVLPVEICQYYLGDFVTIIINLYCLCSMPLAAFSSRVIRVFEFRGIHIASSIWDLPQKHGVPRPTTTPLILPSRLTLTTSLHHRRTYQLDRKAKWVTGQATDSRRIGFWPLVYQVTNRTVLGTLIRDHPASVIPLHTQAWF